MKTRTNIWKVSATTLATLFLAASAVAAPITFNFSGVLDLSGIGGSAITPFLGSYTFESTLLNGSGNEDISPERGSYGPFSMNLQVGATTFRMSTTSAYTYGITVDNNRQGYDDYIVLIFDNHGLGQLLGKTVTSFRLSLYDQSCTAFESTALPLAPDFFASMKGRTASISYSGQPYSSGGTVQVLSADGIPPSLYSQPQSRAVPAVTGSYITSVVANGSEPLAYQWFFAGSPIAGATTSELSLLHVQPADAGTYFVVVSNAFGTVTSSNAMLTVLTDPPCTPLPAGAVAWWRGESNGWDAIGVNDATLSAASNVIKPFYGTGKVGAAFQLDLSSPYIVVAPSDELDVGGGRGFTVEGWIRLLGYGSGAPILSWDDGLGNPGASLAVKLSVPPPPPPAPARTPSAAIIPGVTSLWLEASFADTNSSPPRAVLFPSPLLSLPTNAWMHVALTFDRSSGWSGLYLNGASVARTNLGAFRPHTAAPIYLGRRVSAPRSVFTGSLDEFAVYNRALEAAEIQVIVAADAAGKCPPPPPPCAPLPPECVAWWRCESNLLDNAGINHGSVTGTVYSAPGRVGSALRLNGGFGRVPKSDSLNIGTGSGLTVAAWIKTSDSTSCPIVEWNDSGGLTDSMGVRLSCSSAYPGGVLEADLVDAQGGSHVIRSPSGLLAPSIWQHVAVTYDNATALAALYCDGNLVAQTNSGVFIPRTTGDLYLGYRPPGPYAGSGSKFIGYLDEIMVHARALSPIEIKTTAKAGGEGSCKAPPVIVSQPASLRANLGFPAQFNIEAAGNPILSYQWFKDDVLLPGATGPSLVIAAAQDADAGSYTVLVTNWFGAVLSSNALLTINHSPIADASATPTQVIAPLQGPAAVLLDGSRSSDPDGDHLAFSWFLGSEEIATGVVAVVPWLAGAANIALVADDGLLQATNLVTVQILTPAQAIDSLMTAVSAGVPRSHPLLATLQAALAAVNRGNAGAAASQLEAFQNKVRAQVSPQDPALAITLIRQAQEIIDALSASSPGRRRPG